MFAQILAEQMKGMFPGLLYWSLLPLIPFIIAEQLRPVGKAPGVRDYGLNILISWSTACLALPLGTAAGLWSARLHHLLPWKPFSFTFENIGSLPIAGPVLEVLAMIFVPLFLHDFWYYWSHRLEHKVPALWAFHRLHHSDERMNTTTWARDHFMQEVWNTFFSIFTLGLVLDLDLSEAGKAALYSQLFLRAQSMFYHSAIRVQLPWLDRILVTPQLHRIHHSANTHSTTIRTLRMPCRSSISSSARIAVRREMSSRPPASVLNSPRRAHYGRHNGVRYGRG